ncbi:MAG: biliverdin-producing heme oxygenase [Proteobacteria bacterium]|nr:biliverdin-producing heme oxygenase [Pseudomonadota bacterium]
MILASLRTATGSAHRRLEDGLALLDPPLERERFARTLVGFHAFHRAWEPLVERLTGEAAFLAPRRRLALLEADLAALGAEPARASDPIPFLTTRAEAWGSLYVMEGSALGGLVISKVLQGADWLPKGGLTYFNPYGRRTMTEWRTFLARLEAIAAQEPEEEIVSGAVATFAHLQARLVPLEEAA